MYISYNSRIEALYIDIIDTYLLLSQYVFNKNHNIDNLKQTTNCLKNNNSFITNYIKNVVFNMRQKYFTMHCINFIEQRFFNRFNILINDNAYNIKIRNKNFRYFRIFQNENFRASNTFVDKSYLNLEIIIFLVLYFTGHGYYRQKLNFKKTIFKNVQRKLNIIILHFKNNYY